MRDKQKVRIEFTVKWKTQRIEKGISRYRIVNDTTLKYIDLKNIEEGVENYTVDKLLEYISYIKRHK